MFIKIFVQNDTFKWPEFYSNIRMTSATKHLSYSGFLFLRSKILQFKKFFLISIPWLISVGLLPNDC